MTIDRGDNSGLSTHWPKCESRRKAPNLKLSEWILKEQEGQLIVTIFELPLTYRARQGMHTKLPQHPNTNRSLSSDSQIGHF